MSDHSDPHSSRPTTSVFVELSPSHVPPTLPFDLRDHVSPNTWEARVSTLVQLASMYCRPSFEKAYLFALLVLTFLAPIMVYYIILERFQNPVEPETNEQVWLTRFIAFAVMVATWIVLSVPIVIWKYLGKVRVAGLAELWTRTDALAAQSYGAAPIWKATTPGFFRNAIVLTVTIPVARKSHFDPNGHLPPYIAKNEDGLPPYRPSRNWSEDLKGGVKFGELPIYSDATGRSSVAV